jgi:hypothetical protein
VVQRHQRVQRPCQKGQNSYGSNFIQRQREAVINNTKNVFETYRAEVYAPPQLDAVEIEVTIGSQREIDFVVYDRL